ncbi:MAG: pseudouridine synthase [Bacteroidota bacterium]|nr:pseudouridine synthase [Bacteroidota bacterium]
MRKGSPRPGSGRQDAAERDAGTKKVSPKGGHGIKRKSADTQRHARLERAVGKQKPRRHTVAIRETEKELRLNKFLSEAGVASRRKADEMIAQGLVRVNGRVVTELGAKVHPARDEVSVKGTPVYIQSQLYYLLLNKPKDCITTTDDELGRRTVMDLIPTEHHVYPVGRLDRNTTGALLLTNDGDLANKLMHPGFAAPKNYIAELTTKVKPQDLQALRRGIKLEDGMTAPCDAEILNSPAGTIVGLTIHEGRNRQVRRMFETLGYAIRKLDRISFAGLGLGGLRRGAWRYLEEEEVRALRNLAKKTRD